MPFADLTVTDNFNRADANPVSGNWVYFDRFDARVVSNEYACPSPANQSQWTWGSTVYTNVAASFLYSVVTGGDETGALLRLGGSAGAANGYQMFWDGTPQVVIRRLTAGVATLLASAALSIASGYSLGFKATGSLLEIYYNANAGAGWLLAVSARDATYATGKVGLTFYSSGITARLDDFAFAELTGTVNPSDASIFPKPVLLQQPGITGRIVRASRPRGKQAPFLDRRWR